MKRRVFLLGAAVAATALPAGGVRAQGGLAASYDVDTLVARALSEEYREILFVDVAFVHTWRATLRPAGYEGEAAWQEGAEQNRIRLWQVLLERPAVVAENLEFVREYSERIVSIFEEKVSEFRDFLTEIGIEVEGAAAARINESLYYYALLNAAVFGNGVEEVAAQSYMWPRC